MGDETAPTSSTLYGKLWQKPTAVSVSVKASQLSLSGYIFLLANILAVGLRYCEPVCLWKQPFPHNFEHVNIRIVECIQNVKYDLGQMSELCWCIEVGTMYALSFW